MTNSPNNSSDNHPLPIFNNLVTSLNLAVFKQQGQEPQYEALDSHSHEADRLSRCSEYAQDILRIYRELELSQSLIAKLPSDDFFTSHNTTKEDFVMYHQGHYLDLVHQLKDKLTHLVGGLISPPPFKEKKKVDPIKLSDSPEAKKIPGLSESLKVWTQETSAEHGIAVVLRQRTQYHHFRNRLHLNSDLQMVKLSRTIQAPGADNLSNDGKKLIEERGKEGFDKWYGNVQRRMKATTDSIKENIETVGGVLSNHFPLPDVKRDAAKILDDYFKMQESLKIKSVASTAYKETPFYPVVGAFEDTLSVLFGDNILANYLIGSVTRGDAVFGLSDVNFVIIVKNESGSLEGVIKLVSSKLAIQSGVLVDVQVVSEADFKSEDFKKIRFLCKTDGLLLKGADFIGEEKFPKPGLELSCLLNQGLREKIAKLKKRIEERPPKSQPITDFIARQAAKISLRLMFSAVMADTAQYKRSTKEIYEAILKQYPQNKAMTGLFYQIAVGEEKVDLENLKNLLTAFDKESSLGKLLDQLDEKCQQLKDRKKY